MSQNSETGISGPAGTGSNAAMLAGLVALCLAVGGIGGWATVPEIDGWYSALNKPALNPPNWIFGPVWTALYVMMGIAMFLYWRQAGWNRVRMGAIWFGIQLLLNLAWSFIFFRFHQPGWAFFEIIFLWIAIAICIGIFAGHSRGAAVLMLPYIAWVSFASWLNYSIWQLN